MSSQDASAWARALLWENPRHLYRLD